MGCSRIPLPPVTQPQSAAWDSRRLECCKFLLCKCHVGMLGLGGEDPTCWDFFWSDHLSLPTRQFGPHLFLSFLQRKTSKQMCHCEVGECPDPTG